MCAGLPIWRTIGHLLAKLLGILCLINGKLKGLRVIRTFGKVAGDLPEGVESLVL